jgi:hypothetical protein
MTDATSTDDPTEDADPAQADSLVPPAAADTLLFAPPAGAGDGGEESDDFAPAGVQRPLDGKVRVSNASGDELEKSGLVYVEAPGYQAAARVLAEHRLVHLVGPDHAGKYAMAHALARRQREAKPGLRIRTLRCGEDVSILDVLEDKKDPPPPNSIIIIRDAFATPGLQRNDFRGAWGPLKDALEDNEQYLILTTDSELPADAPTGGQQTVDVPPLPAELHPELLTKHFVYYEIPESWRSRAAEMALKSLQHPYQFDLFALRLRRLEAPPRHPQLEVIVRDIKDSALSVRVWFAGLNPNQRYFAMMACLLPGLGLDDLWQLYEKLYVFLKGQGIQLDPPLNYGREDLLESIQAHRTAFGTVEFNSPIFAQGALTQAQYNYREPFRLLLPKFAEAIESTVADKRRAARERRQALIAAIGLLGQADLRWVQPVLLQMAQHTELDIRVAAATVLRRICDVEEQQQPVANLLAGWTNDNRPRVRWTAAAAYSKLPRPMVASALKPLGKMTADTDFVREEAAYALEYLFTRAPDEVIGALNGWLAEGNATTARTVRLVIRAIANNDPKMKSSYFREVTRQDAFWPLLDHILRYGSPLQMKAGLSLLRSWLERAEDPLRSLALEEKMLATARLLGQQRHDLFKSTLSEWLAEAGPQPQSALYHSANKLAREMVYIQPLLEIDESDLVEDVIMTIELDELPPSTPPTVPPATASNTLVIDWLDIP